MEENQALPLVIIVFIIQLSNAEILRSNGAIGNYFHLPRVDIQCSFAAKCVAIV